MFAKIKIKNLQKKPKNININPTVCMNECEDMKLCRSVKKMKCFDSVLPWEKLVNKVCLKI